MKTILHLILLLLLPSLLYSEPAFIFINESMTHGFMKASPEKIISTIQRKNYSGNLSLEATDEMYKNTLALIKTKKLNIKLGRHASKIAPKLNEHMQQSAPKVESSQNLETVRKTQLKETTRSTGAKLKSTHTTSSQSQQTRRELRKQNQQN